MKQGLRRTHRRALVVGAMAILAAGVGASSASAAEISINPTEVSVGTLKPAYPVVEVVGTGFNAYVGQAEKLRVGLCTGRVFGEAPVFAPACGLFAEVTVDSEGGLAGEVELEPTENGKAIFVNEHAEIPQLKNQPPTFNCLAEQSEGPKLGCHVVAVDHSTGTTILDTAALTFTTP